MEHPAQPAPQPQRSDGVGQHPTGITAGQILDSSLDAIVIMDRAGIVRAWNRNAESLFGFVPEQAVGRELAELLVPPDRRQRHRADIARCLRRGDNDGDREREGRIQRRRLELPARRADGTGFPAELTVTPVVTGEETFFIGTLRDIGAQRRAQRRLAAQFAINHLLASARSIDGTAEEIIRALCASLECEAGAIWAVDDAAQVLRCVAVWSQPEQGLEQFIDRSLRTTFTAGVGLPGRVWAGRQPASITDLEVDGNFPRLSSAKESGLHGGLAFPIMGRDGVLGVVELFSREPQPLDEALLITLGALGSQIGQFVERARVEHELSGVRRELSDHLAEINRLQDFSSRLAVQEDSQPLLQEVLTAVVALQDADMGVLMLYDPGRDDLYTVASVGLSDKYLAQVGRVARGEGACGRALAERRAVTLYDVMQDPIFAPYLDAAGSAGYRAVFSAPLLTLGGEVVGTIATYFRWPHQPTARERSLVELYAHQAAELVEISRLYREAARAVRVREEFLSTAAHELKTPLTTIKGYSQLLTQQMRRETLDLPRLRQLIEQLARQVGRMELLVTDLLDTSRIQQGRLELRREPVELTALARAALGRFEQAPELLPGHRLEFEAGEELRGCWDPARLDQVFTNLLSNALKYSPDGGAVRVALSRRDDVAEIRVRDEGVGIPRHEQSQIFQPFARAETASRNISGVGLGLFISAQILQRHGGSIAVESQPGQGSTFIARLPLGPCPDQPPG